MKKETKEAVQVRFDPNLKTVLYVIRDKGGCGFYRCLQPATSLRSLGLMNSVTSMRTITPEKILKADIIVFQSIGTPETTEAINFAKKNNKPVVVEVDDYLNVVSPNNPGYGAWNPGNLYLYRAINAISDADAMTVTTNQLAREYFPYNKNIYILPNYLSQDQWDIPTSIIEDDYIRIGWAGGNAHIDDLRMIAPVIEKIVKEYKGKIKFETMGMTKRELQDTFKLEFFGDICPKCGYQGETFTHPGESLQNFPYIMSTFGWDIALAPCVDTAFNNAKSWLKLKEYSALGYPTVASDITPYREAKEDGCKTLLAKNFKEWYNNIKRLIKNKEERIEISQSNKEWVSNHWIDDNIIKYKNAYLDIINKHKSKK